MAIAYEWRGEFDNAELNALHAEAFEHRVLEDDWRRQVHEHSLGWVCARDGDELVGFVNVAWDGGVHAFVLDTMVTARAGRQGVGTELVAVAVAGARTAGCEWLHVDFEDHLRAFYFEACGFTPTNAGLIGISRLSYSLAGADLLPRRFNQLHPKFHTPYFSIIVFGVAAALLVLPGIFAGGREIDLLSAVYSLAATFAFCSAHLSVMRLRFIEPDLHRPYRMPFNVKFGRDSIPIISVVGALAIGTVFTQLMFQNISSSTFIYLGWLILGGATYAAYRRYRRQPIWEPLESPPPHLRELRAVPWEPQPRSARYKLGRRERIAAQAAAAPRSSLGRRARWRLEMELFFARHGVRGSLVVLLFAATSGLAVLVDLSPFDPTGPGLGWSPGLVAVAFLAAYLLIRSRAER